jgi:hypothetical protein
MATYEITAPDGNTYEITAPEGASEAQVLAYAQSNYKSSQEPARGRPTMQNDPRIISDTESRPSNEGVLDKVGKFLSTPAGLVTPEQLGGSRLGRAAQGLLDPLLGIGQIGANLLGNDTVNQRMRQNELRYQQARAASGDSGVDVERLGGNIANPANYMIPGAGAAGLTRAAVTGATLSATQPVYDNEFWNAKGTQAAVGAILGPLAEYGVKGAGRVLDSFKGLTESGRLQAVKDLLDKASGSDKALIVKTLQEAKPIVQGSKPTAMEALAETPAGAPIAALQKTIQRESSVASSYLARRGEQEAARQAELASIAGTEAERVAMSEARGELFGKYAQPALDANDTVRIAYNNIEKSVMGKLPQLIQSAEELQAGQAASQAAIMKGSGAVPKAPSARETLTEAATNKANQVKAYQREALAETGVFPLEVNTLVSKLNSALRGTKSDEAKKVIEGVKSDLLDKADNNGFLSSVDLYENVRKVMNQNINRYLNQGQQPFQGGIPQQAAAAGDSVKKLIDSELNKSSNGLWGKYLEEYSVHSKKLDRMAIGEALEKKLGTSLGNKERAASFAQAVDNAGSLIKKATGQPRYEKISQVLTPEETGAVNRVLADLSRLEKGKTLAGSVNAPEYAPKAPLEGTSLLSRAYTLTKEAMQLLSRGNKEAFEQKFMELALEPQAMATLMQAGGITKQRQLIEAINKNLSPKAQQVFVQSFGTTGTGRAAGE